MPLTISYTVFISYLLCVCKNILITFEEIKERLLFNCNRFVKIRVLGRSANFIFKYRKNLKINS